MYVIDKTICAREASFPYKTLYIYAFSYSLKLPFNCGKSRLDVNNHLTHLVKNEPFFGDKNYFLIFSDSEYKKGMYPVHFSSVHF